MEETKAHFRRNVNGPSSQLSGSGDTAANKEIMQRNAAIASFTQSAINQEVCSQSENKRDLVWQGDAVGKRWDIVSWPESPSLAL